MADFLVLWDLDGTLCPHSPAFHQQAPLAVAKAALAAGVTLSAEETLEFAQKNYPGQKTAIHAFATRFNLDEQELFQLYYQHLQPDFLIPDEKFIELVKKSTALMYHGVFTQAPSLWINKALQKLDLLPLFNSNWLLGYERLGRSPKNSNLTHTLLANELAKAGYSANQVTIIDDRDFILEQLAPLARYRICINTAVRHIDGLLYKPSVKTALEDLLEKLHLLDSSQGSATTAR